MKEQKKSAEEIKKLPSATGNFSLSKSAAASCKGLNPDLEINENLKELVITKIQAGLPSNFKISVGSSGILTKEEMIQHIKEGDKQGKQIIDMHLNFMKALVSGELMKEINSIE